MAEQSLTFYLVHVTHDTLTMQSRLGKIAFGGPMSITEIVNLVDDFG